MDESIGNKTSPAASNYGLLFRDGPEHPILIDIYAYWKKQVGDQEMPHYADIDPIDIPALMPHVAIGDIIDREKMNIRVRLFGTALSYLSSTDRTGMILEESHDGDTEPRDQQILMDRWRFLARKCCSKRAPVFTTRVHSDPDRQFLNIHTAAFPLLGSKGEIERILVAMAAVSSPAKRSTD